MEKISQFFLASLLLLTLLPAHARCDGEDEEIITPQALPNECFKVFQEKAKGGPNNLQLIISHKPVFGFGQTVPSSEFHFHTAKARGRISITLRGGATYLTRQYRYNGFVAIESVLQMKFLGDIKKSTAIEACEAYANDLGEFLKPQPKFKLPDLAEKFKAKFGEVFADKKLVLIDLNGGAEPAAGSDQGAGTGAGGEGSGEATQAEGGRRRLSTKIDYDNPELGLQTAHAVDRKLVMPTPRSREFQLATESNQVIGNVHICHINEHTITVEAKVNNEFQSKTFISTLDKPDKAYAAQDKLIEQMKGANIPEDFTTADMEALVTKLMTKHNCLDPKLEFKSGQNYVVLNWVKGQKFEEANSEDEEGMNLLRERRLAGECPFNMLNAVLIKRSIDGFPNLEVFFEGNTQFPSPIILNYQLSVNSKNGVEQKMVYFFDNFVDIFNKNEQSRLEQQKKDDAYDKALKDYNQKIQEDLPGAELLKKPEPEHIPVQTVLQVAGDVQNRILAQNAKAGAKVDIHFEFSKPADETGADFEAKFRTRTLMKIKVTPDSFPKVYISFIHYPDYKGEREVSYSMEITSDPRLHQIETLDAEFAKYFKQEFKFVRGVV